MLTNYNQHFWPLTFDLCVDGLWDRAGDPCQVKGQGAGVGAHVPRSHRLHIQSGYAMVGEPATPVLYQGAALEENTWPRDPVT